MARYRYRGRFISESRAQQLANLKGPSKYLQVELSRAERAERQRRSEAARRGWEVRRQREAARSEAARRGWETRRRREAAAEREAERARRSEAARRGWETRRAREAERRPPPPVYVEEYEPPPDVPMPEDYYPGMEPYFEPDLDDWWDSILADDFDDEDYETRYSPTK